MFWPFSHWQLPGTHVSEQLCHDLSAIQYPIGQFDSVVSSSTLFAGGNYLPDSATSTLALNVAKRFGPLRIQFPSG
jgi:hypothetical protein